MGTNLSFPVWVRLAERDGGASLAFTLRAVRLIDRWITIPAYGLLALTGLALAIAQGLSLSAPWLAISLALFVGIVAAGALFYAPVSRKRLEAAERGGAADRAYREQRRRADALDAFIVPAALLIVALMVAKPSP